MELLQDPVEGGVFTPTVKPVIRGLPGTVALGEVSPGGTAAKNVKDGVEHQVGIATSSACGVSWREALFDESPLLICRFIAPGHDSRVALRLAWSFQTEPRVQVEPIWCRMHQDWPLGSRDDL